MNYKSVRDSREKKGVKVYSFNHTLKNKKYITGTFIENAHKLKTDEIFLRFCIYIKQKDKIVGVLTGVASDWEHFFHRNSRLEMVKQFRKINKFLIDELNHLEDLLWENYDFNKGAFVSLIDEYSDYGDENGFILIDKIWVHPYYRKQGYAKAMFKMVRKRYDSELAWMIMSQPIKFEDETLNIKDRKILTNTFDKLFVIDCDKKKENINKKVINKIFSKSGDVCFKKVKPTSFTEHYYYLAIDCEFLRKIREVTELPF